MRLSQRATPAVLRTAALAIIAATFLYGQGDSRSPGSLDAERTARDRFNAGEYDRAVPVLERAVQAEPGDLKLASLLGMAYLYSSSNTDLAGNLTKAREVLDKVLSAGGEVVFLAGKGDDPLKSMSVHMVKVIQGELRLRKDSVTFVPSRSSTGGFGPLAASEVKECAANKGYGQDSNAFHLKLQKETVNLRPLHFSREEANLACSLIGKYLGAKTSN